MDQQIVDPKLQLRDLDWQRALQNGKKSQASKP